MFVSASFPIAVPAAISPNGYASEDLTHTHTLYYTILYSTLLYYTIIYYTILYYTKI